MPRRANWRQGASCTLAALGLGACTGSPTQPAPTNLANEASLVDPPRRPEKTGRFKDPNTQAPGPRDAQIPAVELEAALREAKGYLANGAPAKAIPALQRCANKAPLSARCDGELGIVLAELGTQKPHMRYFLAAAADTNDPAADAELYRRIAAAARTRGLAATRAAAMATLDDRGEATAADHHARAQGLSADPATLADAIQALARACTMDPSQHAWLLEWAVLTAQTDDTAAAVDLLQRYLEAAPANAPQRASARQRLASLQRELPAEPAPPPRPLPTP